MYTAIINGKSYEIEPDEESWRVNGAPFPLDISSLGNDHYHILYNHRSYQTEVEKIDRTAKTVELKINGVKYSVQVRDKLDLLLEKMGMNGIAAGKVMTVKAPMPGLIVDLRVAAGSQVKAGDALLVLEAMKMENIIKASGDGTVKNVKIKKGDSVEKGQLLIEF